MPTPKVDLLVAPCGHKAAKWAVEHWHYSQSMPAGKLVKFGVWEDDKFIGAVIFGWGANNHIGSPYGLKMTEVCELVRVALAEHKAQVSQIVAMAVKELGKQSPGLRLIVSYADPEQGHNGGIYQAMNWTYSGTTAGGTAKIQLPSGDLIHKRTMYSSYGHNEPAKIGAAWYQPQEKHKYLYPLDKAMRRQIEPLAQPYPKRADVGEIESRISTTD